MIPFQFNSKRVLQSVMKEKKTIQRVAAYTAKALANTPKRVKGDAPDGSKRVNNANYETIPRKIYTPEADNLIESKRDAAATLKRLNGYEARGAGSFEAHKNKYHEASAFRTMNRSIGSEYIFGAGSTRVRERTRETYRKGTARISREERQKIDAYHKRESALRTKLLNRSITAKENQRLQAQLRKIDAQIRDTHKLSSERLRKLEDRQQALSDRFHERVEARRKKRLAKLQAFAKRNKPVRIVGPVPVPFAVRRKGSLPGHAPKSWPNSGRANYYIGLNDGGRHNYKVTETGPMEYQVSLRPLNASGNVLSNLVHGGKTAKGRYIDGYVMTSTMTKTHRRVKFEAHWGVIPERTVSARDWVKPTLKRVTEYIRKRNG